MVIVCEPLSISDKRGPLTARHPTRSDQYHASGNYSLGMASWRRRHASNDTTDVSKEGDKDPTKGMARHATRFRVVQSASGRNAHQGWGGGTSVASVAVITPWQSKHRRILCAVSDA